jgi:hypothetical protein
MCMCVRVSVCAYVHMPHLSDDACGSDPEALVVTLHNSLRGHCELGGDVGPIDKDVICFPIETPDGDRHGFHGLRRCRCVSE